jgi:hypothetical protein
MPRSWRSWPIDILSVPKSWSRMSASSARRLHPMTKRIDPGIERCALPLRPSALFARHPTKKVPGTNAPGTFTDADRAALANPAR